MKRFVAILCVCVLMSVVGGLRTDADASLISFNTDIKEYVREHFDEIYPGVSEEAKRWLSYELYYREGHANSPDGEGEIYDLHLTYKDEETISVMIKLKVTAFPIEVQVIDQTPEELAEIINLYESGISREEAGRIAMTVYPEVLKKVCEERPEAAARFIAEYGQDALDPEHFILNSHWMSDLNGGSAYDSPFFSVFFTHELEMLGPSRRVGDYWFLVDIDAQSGEILEISDTDNFFMVRPYLFRDTISRWDYDW